MKKKMLRLIDHQLLLNHDKRLDDLVVRKDAHDTRLGRHAAKLSILEQQGVAARKVLEAHADGIAEISAVLEQHDNNLTELNAISEKHTDLAVKLQADVQRLERQGGMDRDMQYALQKVAETHRKELDAHAGVLDADKVMVSALQAAVVAQEKRLASLDDEKDALWSRYNYLSGEVEATHASLRHLTERVNALETFKAEAERVIAKSTFTIGLLTLAMTSMDDKAKLITDLQNENRAKSERIENMAVRLRGLEDRYNGDPTRGQVDELLKRMNNAERNIKLGDSYISTLFNAAAAHVDAMHEVNHD